MATTTSIEWTDVTWNPVTGCSKVSPGCAHCYAETVAGRFWPQQYVHTVERGFISVKDYHGDKMTGTPRQFTDVMTHEDRLDQPLRWKKPRRVFVNSMSDLFHEDVPDAFIDRVFAVMALAPQHTFQILTKRAERMRDYVTKLYLREVEVSLAITRTPWWDSPQSSPCAVGTIEDRIGAGPLPNVWLGVSVENQHFADERIPLLLETPAAVRFISAEPLLGPVNLTSVPSRCQDTFRVNALNGGWDVPRNVPGEHRQEPRLHWVIVGGESGPGARPFDVSWARSIIQHCRAAGVPAFVKQLGADPRDRNDAGFEGDTPRSWPMDTDTVDECARPFQGDEVRVRLANRKGGDPEEWPEDLRVRQFPQTGATA